MGRGGSLAELEQLYRERYPVFLRVARATVRDHAAAADAVQDAFVQAVRNRRSYRREGTLEAWVWRMVVNAARKRGREPRVTSLEATEVVDPSQNGFGDPVRVAAAALPERQRLVLFLRYYADLDYAAIAVMPRSVNPWRRNDARPERSGRPDRAAADRARRLGHSPASCSPTQARPARLGRRHRRSLGCAFRARPLRAVGRRSPDVPGAGARSRGRRARDPRRAPTFRRRNESRSQDGCTHHGEHGERDLVRHATPPHPRRVAPRRDGHRGQRARPGLRLACADRARTRLRAALEAGSARTAGEDVIDGERVTWVVVVGEQLPSSDGTVQERTQEVAVSNITFEPVATRHTVDGRAGETLQRVLDVEALPAGQVDLTIPKEIVREGAIQRGRNPIAVERAADVLGRTPLWLGREHASLPLTQTNETWIRRGRTKATLLEGKAAEEAKACRLGPGGQGTFGSPECERLRARLRSTRGGFGGAGDKVYEYGPTVLGEKQIGVSFASAASTIRSGR